MICGISFADDKEAKKFINTYVPVWSVKHMRKGTGGKYWVRMHAIID